MAGRNLSPASRNRAHERNLGGRVPGGEQRNRGANTAPPQPHKGGHGVGHLLTQTVDDLKNAAVNLPGGLYHTAGGLIHHPVKTVEAIGKTYATDLRHPLRHPGNTLLDVLSLVDLGAGTVARAGAVGRALSEGAAAGEVGRSLVRGPRPQARHVKTPDTGVKVDAGTYSRAASSRAVQKGLDRLREKYPNVKFGTRNQYERAGFNRSQNERVKNALANAPAHQIVAQAKKLKLDKAQRLAIRVVAEEVPLETRIADAERFVSEVEGKTRRMLHNHVVLLKRAREYVHDVEHDGRTVPRFMPKHHDLSVLYEKVKTVADKREADLVESGALTKAGAEVRKSAPGNLGFNPDHAPEVFTNREGFFVSYRNGKNPKGLGGPPQLGVQGQIGVPKNLPELGHSFTGDSIRTGNVNPDTVTQVAQDSMRANKLLTLWRQRDELAKLAKPAATNPKYDIPIRPIWLKNKPWPKEVRAYLDKLDKGLEPEADVKGLAKFREFVFPSKEEAVGIKGITYIDRRLLDKQNLPSPAVGIGSTTPVKIVDAVNQAERAAILFKPAYVLPNLASNVAINIVQQGFAAVPNLSHSVLMHHSLPANDLVKIRAGMQSGVVASLGNQGIAKGAVSKIQHGLGKLVDQAPRESAFYFEAKRVGYKTTDDIHRLLNDPKLEGDRVRVFREANGEIIDYERLGPIERDLIRRFIFLYPWVKGSTVYAGRFLREHPVKAGVLGAIGEQQTARSRGELGPLPSYLEGIFKVGGSQTEPLISNAASVSPFGTPTQVLEALAGLAKTNPGEAYQLSQFLVPLLQAQQSGARTNKGSVAGNTLHGLYETLPPVSLEKRLRNPNQDTHIYPYDRREALLQYLLGSPSPHRLNKRKANAAAHAEKKPKH